MDRWVDLHLHTYHSDGLWSPSQLVMKANELKLSAIGICDHDTISALEEAESIGLKYNIEVVPGLELSSQYKGRDIHILGYYIDRDNQAMTGYLELFREERVKRAAKMVVNLNQDGVHILMDDVRGKAQGQSIGRPHIAEVLMEKGYVETFQEAFQRFIGYGAASYVEKYKIQPDHAIRLISEARGLAILAHPGPILNDEIILDLIKFGIDGFEVVHPNLDARRTQHLMEIAKKYGLLITGGSDCHGGRTGDYCIGKYNVPYSVLESMKEKRDCVKS